MKISIQMLTLGSLEFYFLFNHHQPIVEVQSIQYSSLEHLIQKCPQLIHPQNIDKLAQIANFMVKGLEFQYIENIEAFRENYYQQIEIEQLTLLYEGTKLKDYGIFDLSDMHPPRLNGNQLIFFVRHDYLGIPYRVTLFFPITNDTPQLSYELLTSIS